MFSFCFLNTHRFYIFIKKSSLSSSKSINSRSL
nr:MAG TPA: hypothetical protein [Crassvirales sp.]